MPRDREFDIVLMGATGFTGGLTAEYLARHAPASLRWALAGRNPAKLAAVRDRLAGIDPRLETMQLIEVDSADAVGLRDLAERTGSIVTTVGPYLEHGSALVGACAEAGTDYLDLTGEPEFVDRMYVEHHAVAERTGARLVHACGFDSIPYDLGVFYTVGQLEERFGPITSPLAIRGVVRASGLPSGGTFASALTQLGRLRQSRDAFAARRRRQPRPEGRSSRAVAGKPHRDPVLGRWLVPLPTIDPQVVARSGAALERYGPKFTYGHFAGVKKLPTVVIGAAGVGAIVAAAQVPPLRRALAARVPQGEGPDADRRAASWFKVDLIAELDDHELHTRVTGGDPGYGETSKMLAEAALCLACDDNPTTAGQVTTAQAMGERLLTRLQAAGISFETL